MSQETRERTLRRLAWLIIVAALLSLLFLDFIHTSILRGMVPAAVLFVGVVAIGVVGFALLRCAENASAAAKERLKNPSSTANCDSCSKQVDSALDYAFGHVWFATPIDSSQSHHGTYVRHITEYRMLGSARRLICGKCVRQERRRDIRDVLTSVGIPLGIAVVIVAVGISLGDGGCAALSLLPGLIAAHFLLVQLPILFRPAPDLRDEIAKRLTETRNVSVKFTRKEHEEMRPSSKSSD